MIAEGRYLAKCVGAKLSEKEWGAEYCELTFQLLEGPNKGEQISKDLYFDDNLQWSLETLALLGMKGTDIEQCGQCVGGEARIKITHKQAIDFKTKAPRFHKDGSPMMQAKVSYVDAVTKKLEASKASSFAQRVAEKAAALGLGKAAAPAATPAATPAPSFTTETGMKF